MPPETAEKASDEVIFAVQKPAISQTYSNF
jgi:hypothetical protein